MKKLLQFIIAIIFSFGAESQTFTPVHNYQAPDGIDVVKYFGIPSGATPTLNGINRVGSHPLWYNTTDSSLYIYTGHQWTIVGTGGRNNVLAGYLMVYAPNDSTLAVDTTALFSIVSKKQFTDSAFVKYQTAPDSSYLLSLHSNRSLAPDTLIIDGSGLGTALSTKVDSVTSEGTKIYYWINGSKYFVVNFNDSIVSYKWSIIDSLSVPPVTPYQGDIYLVGTSPTGAFSGQENNIAVYDTTAGYIFQIPTLGDFLYNSANAQVSKWTGTVWERTIVNGYVHINGEEAIIGKKKLLDTLVLTKPVQIITTPNVPVTLLTAKIQTNPYPWFEINANAAGTKLAMGSNNLASGSGMLTLSSGYIDSLKTGIYRPFVVSANEFLELGAFGQGGVRDSAILFKVGYGYNGIIHGNGKLTLNKYGSGTFTGTPAKQLSVTSSGDIIETNQPIITSGTSAPSSTPAKVGDIYVDTSAKKLYFATGTSSSSDWTIAN